MATDACLAPVDSYGDHDSSGGVVRNCGSDADHENPVAGVTNYLYGTLRNTRPGSPRVVYAEVGVYYALASSGLTYPADFTFIPEFAPVHRSASRARNDDEHRADPVDAAAGAAGQ